MSSRTANSAAILIAARLCAKLIDLALLIALARLLTPSDFGLVAIAMTLVFIVEAAMELSTSSIIVRFPTVDQDHLDTAFTMGLIRAGVVAAILCACAWPIARFYGDFRLLGIICTLSAAPAARGMLSPRLALFARKIDFRRDAVIEVGGKIVACAAGLFVAWYSHSYWGIVAATIGNPVTMVAISYVVAPYRPRLSLRRSQEFLSFLRWSTSAQIVGALNWQVDRLILGHFVPRADLGRYALATDVSSAPFQALVPPMMRPLMAALASRKDQPQRIADAYLGAMVGLVTIGAPVMVGLAMLADPAVPLLLGAKWHEVIWMIQILAFCVVLTLLYAPLAPLAYSLDHGRAVLKRVTIELVAKTVLLLFGAMWWGILAALIARALTTLISAVVAMVLIRQIIGLRVATQVAALWRPAVGCTVLAAMIAVVKYAVARMEPSASPVFVILLATTFGAVSYVLAMDCLWRLSGKPAGLERLVHARAAPVFARAASHWRDFREIGP